MENKPLNFYSGGVSLITGGASGIGLAFGKELARRGCHVIKTWSKSAAFMGQAHSRGRAGTETGRGTAGARSYCVSVRRGGSFHLLGGFALEMSNSPCNVGRRGCIEPVAAPKMIPR